MLSTIPSTPPTPPTPDLPPADPAILHTPLSRMISIDERLVVAHQQRTDCLVRKKAATDRINSGAANLQTNLRQYQHLQKQYQGYQHELVMAIKSLDAADKEILLLVKLRDGETQLDEAPMTTRSRLSSISSRLSSNLSRSRSSSSHSSSGRVSYICTVPPV